MFSRILRSSVAAVLLCCVMLGFTACPSSTRKAVDASARLAAQVKSLEDTTESAYNAGTLNKVAALKIAHIVHDKLNPAVKAYTDAVDAAIKAGTSNKSAFARLDSLFAAVEGPFGDILQTYGALSSQQAMTLKLVIEAVQATLSVIRSGFGFARVEFAGGAKWTV